MQIGLAGCSSSLHTSPSSGSAAGSGFYGARGQEAAASATVNSSGANGLCAGATMSSPSATPTLPPLPSTMDEPVDLFPLTPSVSMLQRHSKRSGRLLNESETMQEKHGQEYRFLVPWLAYAIDCTIAAHEVLRQKHGIPAHVSSPASPSANTLNGATDVKRSSRGSANGDPTYADTAGGSSGSGQAALPSPQAELNAFSTREVPAISVHDYLKRIVKYTYVSPSVLVCGCLYLDRLLCMHPCMLLHPYNVFKLFLTSTRMASKIMDTRTLNNHDFSVVGGVTNDDLNALEFLMVELLQNRLYFSRDTFDEYCRPLRLQAAHLTEEASDWGAETAMETPVETRSGVQHQPTRPFLARCNGSNTRSRRSSILSQNEYSVSIASQSGVSPLRSASRPAFPPSASTARSISVDTESIGPARAPASRGGSASTSAPRHPLGTSYSPALPHVPHTAANGGSSPALGAMGGLSGRGASGEDMLRVATHTNSIYQSSNGVWTGQTPPDSVTVLVGVEERGDERARSISLSAPRCGATTSWDATGRPSRLLAASTSTMAGLCTAALNGGRGGYESSPNVCAAPTYNRASASSSRGITASAEDFGAGSMVISYSDRTPTRRAFSHASREGIALPPVVCSGRSERSASVIGVAAQGQRLPPPPDQPRV
ncbi:cyclin 10 [Leishmania major strain Friedlin]|uniref:Cyclin 10 n=1 Tax=Leishmania major TaxID=5664 RepID=Q4QAE2_LEIMA|nr:cyclin 10 [Leishmania major strain Friedlin]CAG9574662.1 cyclin_10 [Leishmania major strain Friedlin]CAJ05276.1 cyclin 10 [Leishmania major strain Friedlin]|eukprot:XP_001683706.1 cyclin 10 [Leishmania major strain Friedlin]